MEELVQMNTFISFMPSNKRNLYFVSYFLCHLQENFFTQNKSGSIYEHDNITCKFHVCDKIPVGTNYSVNLRMAHNLPMICASF